ncbi:MAG: MFS transporter [Limnochordales bacterium]|nr:MFS transporter [Limnochordales bacterium]
MAIPYYRKNLYVLWVATFLVSASWTQIMPFLPLFLAEMGVTDGLDVWAGIAVSAHFVTGIFMMPVWGKLADKYGRKPMAVRAGFSLSVIYLLLSMATSPWHVTILRLFNGALTGFIPMAIALVGTSSPPQYSARFVASVQTSSAAGSVIGPVLGGTLAGIFGIRGSLVASATLVFLSTVLTLIFVQERRRPAPSEPTTLLADLRAALSMPPMWVSLFISMVGQVATMGVQPVLVLHIESMLGQAAHPFLSGFILALPGLALFLSATRWVSLLDRYPLQQVVLIAFVGAGAGYVLSGLVGHIWLWVPLFFAASIFAAAFRPLGAAVVATDVAEDFRGRAFALQTSATTMGGLIGPLLAGVTADYLGRAAVFIVLGVVLLASPVMVARHMAHAKEEAQQAQGDERAAKAKV